MKEKEPIKDPLVCHTSQPRHLPTLCTYNQAGFLRDKNESPSNKLLVQSFDSYLTLKLRVLFHEIQLYFFKSLLK